MFEDASKYIVYNLLGFEHSSMIYSITYFFLYGTVKIFVLLRVIILSVYFVHRFFPLERT